MTENGTSKRVALILGAVLLFASAACTEPPSVRAASADTSSRSAGPDDRGTAPAPTESDLYLIDPQTGAAELLLRAPGAQTNAELSPDGERVVYESWLDETSQIFVLEPNGTTQQLTRGKRGAHDPTWSPDGSQIAFASKPGKGSDADIFVMDSDGSHIRRLVGTPRNDGHPDWSPKGARIAFDSRHHVRRWGSQGALIWVASVRTRTLTRLQVPFHAVDPAWSPDGRWIAYSRFVRSTINGETTRPIYAGVWLMRPDGTHTRRIGKPTDSVFSENPSWSPNGSRIVFQYWPGPLRAINVRTERLRTFPDIVNDEQPSWSPTGIIVSLSPNS